MSATNQTSDKTYRAGIIGLTGIGQSPPRYDLWATRHPQPHSHAAAYAAHPRVEVVAVCELVPELLTQYDQIGAQPRTIPTTAPCWQRRISIS